MGRRKNKIVPLKLDYQDSLKHPGPGWYDFLDWHWLVFFAMLVVLPAIAVGIELLMAVYRHD